MSSRHLPLLLWLLAFPLACYSQFEKTLHETFPVYDAELIRVDLTGDYVLENWAGDKILTETNIALYNVSQGILKHFLESGRYGILTDTSSTDGYMALELYSKNQERKEFKTGEGSAQELVKIKVYIPQEYHRISEQEFQKTR